VDEFIISHTHFGKINGDRDNGENAIFITSREFGKPYLKLFLKHYLQLKCGN